jgi:hypothetical protein
VIYLKDNIEKEREREKERENERKRERAYIFYTRVYIFYTRLERERDFGSRQKVPSSFFLARTVGYQASGPDPRATKTRAPCGCTPFIISLSISDSTLVFVIQFHVLY